MSLLKYIADAYDKKNNKINFYKLYLNNSCVQAHNLILNNNFLKREYKNDIFNYFEKIKKFYNSFSYIARLFKWKKYKHFSLDCDLYGTPLETLSDNQKIKLIQNKTIYTFRLSDLLSIWNVSLSNSIYLTPVPLIPKNPFTNIKFSNADLVNILIKTKYTLFTLPKFIDIYWRSLMNFKIFKLEAINILKEKAVLNYIENGDFSTFFLDIVSMINTLSIYLNKLDESLFPLKYAFISSLDTGSDQRKANLSNFLVDTSLARKYLEYVLSVILLIFSTSVLLNVERRSASSALDIIRSISV